MSWLERRRAWIRRQIREELEEGQGSRALNQYQAARAVNELYAQIELGSLNLAEIDEHELDALGSMIEAELQDRGRRESVVFQSGPEPDAPEPAKERRTQ